MVLKEIARELQGKAANLALRMPISWVNIITGPPAAVDGRTLDGRTQWFLQLLARSGQKPLHQLGVVEARQDFDAFMLLLSGRPAPVGEIVDRTMAGPAGLCVFASTGQRTPLPACCRLSSTSTAAAS